MGYKIKVHSKLESRAVQDHCFKLGVYWQSGDDTYQEYFDRFLFIDQDIQCCALEDFFENDCSKEISVDDFLQLEALEDKIANSEGAYRLIRPTEYGTGFTYSRDFDIRQNEVEDGIRFDTKEQVEAVIHDLKKVLNAHQVANALNIDYEVVNGLNGDGCKIDRFDKEMKRRGF